MTYSAGQLSDLEAIREVARRYCRGVDRLDAEIMKSAYWPDATDDHGAYNGPAYPFVEHCMTSHLKWRATQHCIYNHSIELSDTDGTSATGELYNVAYLFHADSSRIDTWHGRYLDRYEKRGNEWRIAHRVCVHEGTHTRETTPMDIPAERFRQGDADRGGDHLQPLGH